MYRLYSKYSSHNFSKQVSYLIVDEADEDLEMAEDPFLEAGIPELPRFPSEYQSQNVNNILREDSIKISICNPSEQPLGCNKFADAGIENSGIQTNKPIVNSNQKENSSQINDNLTESERGTKTLEFDSLGHM